MNTVYGLFVPLLCWASQKRLGSFWAARAFRSLNFQTGRSGSAQQSGDPSALGGLNRKFFLRWHGRETFFDPQVQAALKERHPSRGDFGKGGFKGYPIDAWQALDRFAQSAGYSDRSLAEFGAYMRLDPVWTTRLLHAVVAARQSGQPVPKGFLVAGGQDLDKENKRRELIMTDWAECWIAHYRLHALPKA
jgi:hypothetical protein